MTINRTPYASARGGCLGHAQPGNQALMSWFLGAYGARGGTNLGIYNCRKIAGSGDYSLHAEGRADDLGIPVGASWGQPLVDSLVAHSEELGIQCAIYRRRIWSTAYPDAGWREYHGESAHDEHAHVELEWSAAQNLTTERINEVMAGIPAPVDWTEQIIMALPTLKEGATGDAVARLQGLLSANRYPCQIDSRFGPRTASQLGNFQVSRHVAGSVRSDGTGDRIAGRNTWTALIIG